jgi:RNA polymerase sigma factor (sigma-70 family)
MAPESTSDAIEELYRREWSALARVALLLTHSRWTAEEIVQEAFVRLQSAKGPIDNPAAWLRTVVVNQCRDTARRRATADRTPLPRPEAVVDAHDETSDALAKLPFRQHAAIVLRYHLDLPEAEIAVALDCRPSTVRSLVHRALATLREELSP